MLAKYWRLRFRWVADQTLTYANAARVDVAMIPWKMTTGAMAHGSEITDDMGFTSGTIVTTGETEGDVQDNSSNLFMGIKGTFKIIADVSSTDGNGYLYVEESTDNSVWPSDQADFDIVLDLRLVSVLTLSTDAVDEGRATNFEF